MYRSVNGCVVLTGRRSGSLVEDAYLTELFDSGLLLEGILQLAPIADCNSTCVALKGNFWHKIQCFTHPYIYIIYSLDI